MDRFNPEFLALERKCERLEKTLTTLIIWISQSSTGVLSVFNCEELLKMLKKI